MSKIDIPFNKRIVLVGGYYDAKDSIKSAMKNFRFSPDPGELEAEYKKMLRLSDHTEFGCTRYESITAPEPNYIWEADWIAGGNVNPSLYTEKIDGYYVRGGRMITMYINSSEYYGFMLGTGEWLFDTEDLFGTEGEYKYLIEHKMYKDISDIFLDRLHKAYESATATDYIAIDDILL